MVINAGAVISTYREQTGITQQALADFIGSLKALVSTWDPGVPRAKGHQKQLMKYLFAYKRTYYDAARYRTKTDSYRSTNAKKTK